MTGLIRRSINVAVAGLVLAAATVVSAPAAQALPMSSCTTTKNVVVVVSFRHWGNGPVVRGCGPAGESGLDVMHAAGFQTTGTGHDGPAFVCRIGSGSFHGGAGYPTPADDHCVNTPPASAYWSYWHADPGQNYWTYSKLGAASYHPKPGSVDYWQFGSTSTSGANSSFDVTPNEVRANTVSGGSGEGPGGGHGSTTGGARNRAVHRGTVKHGGAASSSANRVSTSSPAAVASSSSASKSSAPAGSGVARSSGPTATASSPSDSASAPRVIDGSPAAHSSTAPASGSALPLIIGFLAVLLIGGGAGWLVLRRRSTVG